MKHSERISVIIPTFNYARFLPSAIRSVLAQDVACEVLVVDDGSTDDTRAALEAFAGRITVRHQENKGLPAARNAGIARAKGSWLVFLDADDVLCPGVLSSQLRCLRAAPGKAMAVCRSIFFERLDEPDGSGAPVPSGEWRLFRHDLDAHLCHFNIAPPHAFMVHRADVEKAGGFDPELRACEDHDLWFRLALAGSLPLANPEGLVAYRRHAGSMSRDLERQRAHDALLHHRIADALLREDPRRVPGGLLACLTGCLWTHGRLQDSRPDLAEDLLGRIGEIRERLAEFAGRDASSLPARRPETDAYFLLRILVALQRSFQARPGHTGGELAESLRELLRRLFPEQARAHEALPLPALQTALERLTTRIVC